MKRTLLWIIGVLVLYFYIYAPPFQVLPFGVDKPIMLLCYVYLTYKGLWRSMYSIFSKEFLCLFCIASISAFTVMIHQGDKSILLYDFLFLLECIPCAFALNHWLLSTESPAADRLVMLCSIVAGLISTYLLLNPELTYYTKTTLLKYPEHLVDKFLYRGYGISDGLMFPYPVIQGLCLSFLLLCSWGKKAVYFLFSPLLLISVICNARSGIVPLFVAILLLVSTDMKHFLKYCSVIFLSIIVLTPLVAILIESNEMLKTSLEWFKTTFEILGDLFSGKKSENVDVLLGDFLVFPSTIDQWCIGTGTNLFSGVNSVNSDIGYIIRLYYGGIVYILLWAMLCFFMYRRLLYVNRGMALLLFISLLYFNFKGDFMVVNPSSRFFIFLYVTMIVNKNAFPTFVNSYKPIK